jgi:hypothetical protein
MAKVRIIFTYVEKPKRNLTQSEKFAFFDKLKANRLIPVIDNWRRLMVSRYL